MTGSDRVCMRNRYILYYYQSSTSTMATCDRRGGRVCACPTGSCAISTQWGLFIGSWLQEVMSFSRAFFLSSSTKCWWGCSLRLLPIPYHSSSPPVFSGVRVARSFVFCVVFLDHCFLGFFCHYFVCLSSIYGFRFTL